MPARRESELRSPTQVLPARGTTIVASTHLRPIRPLLQGCRNPGNDVSLRGIDREHPRFPKAQPRKRGCVRWAHRRSQLRIETHIDKMPHRGPRTHSQRVPPRAQRRPDGEGGMGETISHNWHARAQSGPRQTRVRFHGFTVSIPVAKFAGRKRRYPLIRSIRSPMQR